MKINKLHLTSIVVIGIVLACMLVFFLLNRGKSTDTNATDSPVVVIEYPTDLNLLRVVSRYTDELGNVTWVGVSKELKKSYIIENDSVKSESRTSITTPDILKFNTEIEEGEMSSGNLNESLEFEAESSEVEAESSEFEAESSEVEAEESIDETENTNENNTETEIAEESLADEAETQEIVAEGGIGEAISESEIAETKDIEHIKYMSIHDSEDYVRSLINSGYTIYKKLELPYYCDMILTNNMKTIRIIVTEDKLIEADTTLNVADATDYVAKYIK